MKGEHIKNWRKRYFILRDDGSLIGFKAQPEPGQYSDPLNNFTVKDCQVCNALMNNGIYDKKILQLKLGGFTIGTLIYIHYPYLSVCEEIRLLLENRTS